MTARVALSALIVSLAVARAAAQSVSPPPRALTLHDAVDLAREHNHVVRLAALKVEEHEHVKAVTRSAYFPIVRADATSVRVTDTQLVQIPAGALGVVEGARIPGNDLILNQGGQTFSSTGVGIIQPLTQLLKVKAANDVAAADVDVARSKARGVDNDVAVKVHALYYKVLIAEMRRAAVLAKIDASSYLQSERVQQVRYGSALDADLLESRAQSLQVKQELLTTDLQLADLRMQFNDLVGLPLSTEVALERPIQLPPRTCERGACVKLAVQSHPEVAEARAAVAKAEAGLRLAEYEWLPDVEVFAGYSLHDNSAFLANRFGTFGARASINLFDGGRKRAVLRERRSQVAQARENLARIVDEVELRAATAANKVERTRQMMAVSEELLALRVESRRVAAEQLAQGAVLRSQAQSSIAQELDSQALLLQSRLDYSEAAAELDVATGRPPYED